MLEEMEGVVPTHNMGLDSSLENQFEDGTLQFQDLEWIRSSLNIIHNQFIIFIVKTYVIVVEFVKFAFYTYMYT